MKEGREGERREEKGEGEEGEKEGKERGRKRGKKGAGESERRKVRMQRWEGRRMREKGREGG